MLDGSKVDALRAQLKSDVARPAGETADDAAWIAYDDWFGNAYWNGKEAARLAGLALVAEALGDAESAAAAVAQMRAILELWLTGENGDPLVYDSTYARAGGSLARFGFRPALFFFERTAPPVPRESSEAVWRPQVRRPLHAPGPVRPRRGLWERLVQRRATGRETSLRAFLRAARRWDPDRPADVCVGDVGIPRRITTSTTAICCTRRPWR